MKDIEKEGSMTNEKGDDDCEEFVTYALRAWGEKLCKEGNFYLIDLHNTQQEEMCNKWTINWSVEGGKKRIIWGAFSSL